MVIAYVRNLPLDSATSAHLRGGDEFRGWDVHSYLLANLIDAVNSNTYAFVSAHSKRKPKAPEPFTRPKSKVKKKNPLANKFAAMARIAYQSNKKRSKANDGSGR